MLWTLWEIAHFCRHTDTRGRHRLIEEIREIAKWVGPVSQLGYCKRLLYDYHIYAPAEWREQLKEVVVALKPLTVAQASLMSLEMVEILRPHLLLRPQCPRLRRIPPALTNEKGKKDKGENTESTDSDSYST